MRACQASSYWLCLVLLPDVCGAVPFQDFQIWTNITTTGSLSWVAPELERFRFWLEGQGRFGNDATTLSQGIVRPGLGYAIDAHSSLWLGYAYVPTMAPFATTDRNEQRVWEQFVWAAGTEIGTLTTRSRLEQRFRSPGADVGWRFREQLKLTWPIDTVPTLSLVVSDEIFINLNRPNWTTEGFNQNRLFVGIAHRFDNNTKTEIGYMNQYENKDGAPNELHHILALAVQFSD